jgi:hypothetical protein
MPMVDLERLAGEARRTAERSRVRMAARVAIVLVPLVAIAILAGGEGLACGCLGCVLLVLAAGLRWRDRFGVEVVRDGLLLGLVPAAAALLLRGCGIECAPVGSLGDAEWVCLAAGVIAGAGVTVFALRSRGSRRRRWLLTLLVASLTASLGCAGLGTAGVFATLAALVTTASLAWIPVTMRTA